MARLAVRGTFSPTGPRQPAAARRLPRTLGSAENSVHRPSRVGACRRELSSHNAAQPRVSTPLRLSDSAHQTQRPRKLQHLKAHCLGRTGANDLAVHCPLEGLHCVAAVTSRHVLGATCGAAGLNATRTTATPRLSRSNPSKPASAPARRGIPRVKPPSTALPNPSVKRSANGVPPSPGHRYAIHSLWPGLVSTPSSSAYLKR